MKKFQELSTKRLEEINGGGFPLWVVPAGKAIIKGVIVIGGLACGIDAIGSATESFKKGFEDGYNN